MIDPILSRYLGSFEDLLYNQILTTDMPATRIKEAMLYALFPGGKRLRPLLVYLCGEVIEAPQENLDVIAMAVELIHGYSLIHDDLPAMDNDDLRRGKPSCHKAFDEATAILTGDGLHALAIQILVDKLPRYVSFNQALNVIEALLLASGPQGMISGQCLDFIELAKATVSEDMLQTIHLLKTGKLISSCFTMVLAANYADEITAKILRDYATRLGLVFQMQDDYLDRYAAPDLLGKTHASDSANQKFTYAHLYSQNELHQLIHTYFNDAKELLLLLGEKAQNLIALTDYLYKRSH